MIPYESLAPNQCICKFAKWFDGPKRAAFFAGLLVSFVTHYLILVNGFMSPDGLLSAVLYSAGNYETSVGRWGIDWIDSICANRSVSAVSSIACIFLAAIGAVLLVEVLEIKHILSAILTAAAVSVAPALTVTMMYEYCADAYLFSFVAAILAVWCIKSIRKRIPAVIASDLLTMISLCMYQAYLGVVVGLCIMVVILEFLKNERELLDVVKQGLCESAAIFIGLFAYYGGTKVMCKIEDIPMSTYCGFSEFSIVEFAKTIGKSIVDAYRKFAYYYFTDEVIYNTSWHRHKFFMVLFAVLGIAIVYIIWKNKIYKKPVTLLLVLGCLAILPMGLNIVFVIVSDGYVYSMNSMPLMLIIPFLMAVFENCQLERSVLISWDGIAASVAVIFTYYMADVYSYTYLKMSYDQVLAVSNRIVDRMENTEGYYQGMPVAIAEILTDDNFPRDGAYRDYTLGDIVIGPVFHSYYGGQVVCWQKYMLIYLGENVNMCDLMQYAATVDSEEFKEMGIYPAKDSVQIINGVMAVKLTEEAPKP